MTYFLHFIPLHTYNRKACLVLPSHLYRHIAWHVADSDRFGYRKDLLNLALISKDWSDAISVFFEIPLETYSWDMHDFTDAGGGAGKIDEGVEDWEEGRCVKSCFVV